MSALPPDPVFTLPIRIYYYDTDAGGVVHNVAYLRLIEQARSELARHLGWTMAEMRDTGLVPVVRRTEIDYLRPARLDDHLEIVSRLAGMERLRFFLEFEVVRPADSVRIAHCRQTMVTVQLPAGRPKPVPEAWRAAYPHLLTS